MTDEIRPTVTREYLDARLIVHEARIEIDLERMFSRAYRRTRTVLITLSAGFWILELCVLVAVLTR